MDLAHRRLTPDFTFVCFWWRHELRERIRPRDRNAEGGGIDGGRRDALKENEEPNKMLTTQQVAHNVECSAQYNIFILTNFFLLKVPGWCIPGISGVGLLAERSGVSLVS